MDNKDLITRFAEDCFRFEALHQEIDSLIADEVSEVLIYEYEDLANQAAEIVLKLSANGNNVGEKFYRYYVERLEYIIDYFRALLDYEETPLAEDEPNELDDEPTAETHFEGFPADCAFPPPPPFVFKKWEFKSTPTAKDEANAAADEPDTEEEDDEDDNQTAESDETAGEDTPPAELDNENDTQAVESDEAADEPAAGAPISEANLPLPPGVKPDTSVKLFGLDSLSSEDSARAQDTVAMWYGMDDFTWQNRFGGKASTAAEILRAKESCFDELELVMNIGEKDEILIAEQTIRKTINEAIDAISGFRDSEEFKKLIELYPTYKEIEQ